MVKMTSNVQSDFTQHSLKTTRVVQTTINMNKSIKIICALLSQLLQKLPLVTGHAVINCRIGENV